MKRILVTGSRYLQDFDLVEDEVDAEAWTESVGPVVIVQGGCPTGADFFARLVGLPFETWEADWTHHGPGAGPIRNQQMVDAGADICLAFFVKDLVSRGTADCVRRARAAGIPVKEFWESP